MIRKIRSLSTSIGMKVMIDKIIRMVDPYFSLPFSFSFNLSNSCNLHCSFCPKIIFGVTEKELNSEALNQIMKFAKNIKKVQILGLGEPLLNKNFLQVVKRLKDNQVTVSFTTNGLLLNNDLSNQLCQLGVDEIVFSVEGAKGETHQAIKDSKLDDLIANIKELSLIKKENGLNLPRISFNFVGMTNNINELPEVVKLAGELGVETVCVANVMPLDKDTCKYHLHRNPQLATEYIEKGKTLARSLGINLLVYASFSPSPHPCSWYNRPHIGLDGDVYPCNFLGAQDNLKSPKIIWYEDVSVKIDIAKFRLGNILENKLGTIWNNKKTRDLRAAFTRDLNDDRKLNWSAGDYKNLLLKFQGRELTPEEFCRICPHRFRITH